MNFTKDIEVEIYFLSTEEGGRKGPAYNNFRPQFHYDGRDWDAVHVYPDVDCVKPGETARAFLMFLSPAQHLGNVYVGMDFLIREGARTVGRGVIKNLIELEKSANDKT